MSKSLIVQSRPTDCIVTAGEPTNINGETHLLVNGMVLHAEKSPFVKRVKVFNQTVYLVNIDLMTRTESFDL